MKISRKALIVFVFAVMAACFASENASGKKLESVAWADIRAEIATYVCIEIVNGPEGQTWPSFKLGNDEKCVGATNNSSKLASAVSQVLESASPLLWGIKDRIGISYDSTVPVEAQNVTLQETLLSNDMFLRPVLNRLDKELLSQGLKCDDKPVLAEKAERSVNWNEFSNYLAAYFWPDPIHTPTDSNGIPTGEPKYQVHICTGINGCHALIDNRDDYLVYTAIALILDSKFLRLGSDHYEQTREEVDYLQLSDDSLRTVYIHRRLPERIKQDEKVKKFAVAKLKEYFDDLGISLN